MRNDPTWSYRLASARGATPVGQIVSLYDMLLGDFVGAMKALQAGDIEARVLKFNHALAVIAHLQNVLNYDRGGEAARIFARFYEITRGMIVQANIQATPQAIEELISLVGGVREAWYQAEQQLAATTERDQSPPLSNSAVAPEPQAERNTHDEVETTQLQWSA